MGLDINFYKKEFTELDEDYGTRDRDLFDYISQNIFQYVNSGEFVSLKPAQVRQIIKYMSRHNDYHQYDRLIASMTYCLEENQTVYMEADW